jgi:hypothetical protein
VQGSTVSPMGKWIIQIKFHNFIDQSLHSLAEPSSPFIHHRYIYWILLYIYFMPATTRIPEFFSEFPKRLPSVRQIFVLSLFFYSLAPLSSTSHPVYFISFCPSTHTVAKTRRSEGQRVLSRGEAGHKHTNKCFTQCSATIYLHINTLLCTKL